MKHDFAALCGRLLSNAESLLFQWFPNGRVTGREFCVGSLKGEEGKSLKVNLDTGYWADFAAGDKGGDLLSLYAAQHNLAQGQAYQELSGEKPMRLNGAHRTPYQPDFKLEPIPPEAGTDPDQFIHPRLGVPAQVYYYRDRVGAILYVQARYEKPNGGKKEFCPWIWKAGAWRAEGPPRPRPLYGLEQLNRSNPDHRLFVVEGEKCVNALRSVFTQPVLSWPGGANGAAHGDWSELKGRKVILWPDADDPGIKAMQTVAGLLLDHGCQVELVDVTGMPTGWDCADAVLKEGWDSKRIREWLKPRLSSLNPASNVPRGTPADSDAHTTIDAQHPAEVLWQKAGLSRSARGPHCNVSNAALILDYAEQMDNRIDVWYDTFLHRLLYRNALGIAVEWSDEMDTRTAQWIQRAFHMPNMAVHTVQRAVIEYAMRRSRNCVREWMESLTWDGIERLPGMMEKGFGARSSSYAAAVGRCFMLGMAARGMRPGCKVDTLPVFEGKQGSFKSQALAILGGEWFSEVHESIVTKEFSIAIQGKLLVEISELHSFKRAEIEAVKGKISAPIDRFRAPYERHARDYPRQCVFAGTTNSDDWQSDDTGARRFWPIYCHRIDLDWLRTNREQLFAEAVHRYKAGENWYEIPKEAAEEAQEARRVEDPWFEKIEYYCIGHQEITTERIMERLDLKIDRQDFVSARRIAACLKKLGYRKTVLRREGRRRKIFTLAPRMDSFALPATDDSRASDNAIADRDEELVEFPA